MVASRAVCVAVVVVWCAAALQVHGGKITFPGEVEVRQEKKEKEEEEGVKEVTEVEGDAAARGLWESDLFFLQKLSGLFGGDEKDVRRKGGGGGGGGGGGRPPHLYRRKVPPPPSNLRPEHLPLQIQSNRRNDGAKRPPFRPPPPPPPPPLPPPHSSLLPPREDALRPPPPNHIVSGFANQNTPGLANHNAARPNRPPQSQLGFPGVNVKFPGAPHLHLPSTKPPAHPNVLSFPPHKDALPQQSHLQQVSLSPVLSPPNFPYNFVRPISATHTNHINAPTPHLAPHHPNLDLQAPHIKIQEAQVSVPPRLPTRPHLKPSKPLPPRQGATSQAGRPQHLVKTTKPKKPALWGSAAPLSTSHLQQGPQKHHPQQQHHSRPRPQPQRVFMSPQKVIHKKEATRGGIGAPPHVNIPFNPSPQEGKSDSDAFQPVFVASPFMDDLGDDVMKPMVLKEGRDFTTTPPTTPRQPILEDFF